MLNDIPSSNDFLQRFLYSHDISFLPFIRTKTPDIVFQPRDEEDVLKILKFARDNLKPVIPRGSATSGYGGVLPVRGGIVVDFFRMNKFNVDEDSKILIAEPGAVWWDIEKELNKKGLSLRVYPTSAPSSTVGGWISQNGYGVGSLAYGSIADNVVKLRVADFSGIRDTEEIEYYVGMEGTTGIITRAWIRVKDYEDFNYYAFHVDAEKAVKLAYASNYYSALFIDRNYIELKNKVSNTDLPERDTLVIATTKKMDGNEEIGREIWESRFYPMRIKRLGPSLIPAEVLVPSEKLPLFFRKFNPKAQFGSEVWFIKGGKAAVLSFILCDERRWSYVLYWRYILKALKIAKKLGGQSYSTGYYLSKESKNLRNFKDLLEFKKKVDPNNLLNPNKVFPSGLLPKLIAIAEVFS